MSKRIASLHAEIGADTSKLDRALDNSRQDLTGFGDKFLDTFSKVSTGINQAVEVAQKLYQAGKAVYEFARGAAELEYSREKFDRLTVSIGGTSDAMLGKLRMATRGLVSDAQLVQSAGDFISLGLAKTEDQVVRLTRVAGALGMDMNQLVLTLTNQTTMRFDALGVAVDGFDERLNTLKATGMDVNAAFTEAFLQQAETQIERVGDKADTAIGQYQRLEAQIENYTNTLREEPGIINSIVTKSADFLEALNRINQAHKDGLITDKQRTEAMLVLRTYWSDAALVVDELNKLEENRQRINEYSIGQMADYAAMQAEVRQQIEYTTPSVTYLGGAIEEMAKSASLSQHLSMWRGVQETLAGAERNARNYFDEIDRGLASTLESNIKDIEWNLAGGAGLEGAAERINQALENGLDPAVANQFFQSLYVETQELEVELGNITAEEAAQNIADTLNIELSNAQELMDGIVSTFDVLNGLSATIRVKIEADDPHGLLGVGGLSFGPTTYRDSVRSGTFYSGGDNPQPE